MADPRVSDFAIALDRLVREHMAKHPELANAYMRAIVQVGVGLFALSPRTTIEGARAWLADIVRDVAKMHAPWRDAAEPDGAPRITLVSD